MQKIKSGQHICAYIFMQKQHRLFIVSDVIGQNKALLTTCHLPQIQSNVILLEFDFACTSQHNFGLVSHRNIIPYHMKGKVTFFINNIIIQQLISVTKCWV